MPDATESNTPAVYNIDFAHAFMEMARACYNIGVMRDQIPTEEEVIEAIGYDASGTLSLALASQSVIYSYLAIEAWTNEYLFYAWKHSRDCHDAVERLDPDVREREGIVPSLDWFYQDYGCREFVDLKNTDLQELKERIKVVCRALKIEPLHTSNPNLWRRFNQLLVPARMFLTHPIMNNEEMNAIAQSILIRNPLREWADIAVEVIRYMHTGRENELPDWINDNTLLSFPLIDLIFSGKGSINE